MEAAELDQRNWRSSLPLASDQGGYLSQENLRRERVTKKCFKAMGSAYLFVSFCMCYKQ